MLIILASLTLAACADVTTTGAVRWNGNVADYLDGPVPNITGGNIACEPGVTPITSGELPGNPAHRVAHVNDRRYGNSHSWIGDSSDSWIGLDFGREVTLARFAFGRDNTSLGPTDRTLGTCRVQAALDDDWTDLGTITRTGERQWDASRRHEFTIDPPALSRRFRIIVPDGACIDEIECYPLARPAAPSTAPPARPVLSLTRGVCIDRQYHSIPAPEHVSIHASDIRLIKSMGFEFVKLIINPALHEGDAGLRNMAWVERIVGTVVAEGLPVVACIHPEADFKTRVFGDRAQFERLLVFYQAFASHLAARWTPDQLAFQLMTEPFGTSPDPAAWNHWNALQPRVWQAVRREMPGHTLILGGDEVGHIRGLINTRAVDDPNVVYAFTMYDPTCFTHQKASWMPVWWPELSGVPYPSSPERIAAALPGILAGIPDQWRGQAESVVVGYGRARYGRDRLTTRIQQVADWAAYHGGVRAWCGEFGVLGPEYGGVAPADRYNFTRDLREVFEENHIGWAVWSFNEVFTVLGPTRAPFAPALADHIDPEMLDALGLTPAP